MKSTGAETAAETAAAIDASGLDGLLGTVAGDDTVLVVNRDPNGGPTLARTLEKLLKG